MLPSKVAEVEMEGMTEKVDSGLPGEQALNENNGKSESRSSDFPEEQDSSLITEETDKSDQPDVKDKGLLNKNTSTSGLPSLLNINTGLFGFPFLPVVKEKDDRTAIRTAMRKKKEKRRKHIKLRMRKKAAYWSKDKLEANETLQKEIAGRVEECNRRTLYVRWPSTLIINNMTDMKEALGDLGSEGIIRLLPPKRNVLKACFIEFKTIEEAKQTMDTLNEMEYQEEKWFADFVKGKTKKEDDTGSSEMDPFKLHVGMLPEDTTRFDLRNAFSTSCRIDFPRKRKGSRNFAFITYDSKEEALRVFEASKDLRVKEKLVKVTFAKYRKMRDEKEKEAQAGEDAAEPQTKKKKVTSEGDEEMEDKSEDDSEDDEEDSEEDSEEDMDDDDEDSTGN